MIRNITATVLIIFAMAQLMGHDMVPDFHQINCDIENTSDSKTGNKSHSCVNALDEEVFVDIPCNPVPAIQIAKESYVPVTSSIPRKLYYSIWLPPDIS
ncbi:MAG: hypothetical protein HC830_11565 [Bacteroidetes bacterium]|nr:hypothetical protein [Bacteroidales bacterium]NJO69821.1 hypothetical protein [Bacteroidota bacterium]